MRRRRAALRWTLSWILTTLAVASLTVAALYVTQTTPEHGRHPDAERFFPLDLGTTWVYQTRTNGEPTGLATVQISGSALLAELRRGVVSTSRYENFLGRGVPFQTLSYISVGEGRVEVHGERALGQFTEVTPPQVLVEFPLVPGATWTWSGRRGEEPSRTVTSVLESETVHVAGRDLHGCVLLRTNLTSGRGNRELRTLIDSRVCPGIGVVRVEQRREEPQPFLYVEELVEFHGPDGNLVPPEGGLPPVEIGAPAQPGEDPGVDAAHSGHVPGVELDTDRLAWSIARKTQSLYPPVGSDGLVVVAGNDGTVTAIAMHPGRTLWQVQLDGPIVASPVLAGPVVLVADSSKSLFALDARTGEARWVSAFPDIVSTSPVVSEGIAVVAVDDRTLRGLRLVDGAEVWQARTEALVPFPPPLIDGTLVIAALDGGITAVDPGTGRELWSEELPNENRLGAPPAAGEGIVVLPESGSRATALDPADGSLLWRVSAGGPLDSAPAVGNGTAVLLAGFTVQVRDATTGDLRWRRRFDGDASAVPPMILGDSVAVLGENARLHLFRLADGEARSIDVPRPDSATRFSTNLPMAHAGGALVVPVQLSGDWPFLVLLGYHLATGEERAPEGVRLRGELRTVPGPSLGAPALVGEDLLWPGGTDSIAWLVPAEGPARPLAVSEDLVTYAVPAGDVALVPVDGSLAAVPLDGGDPRWTFPTGPPTVGVAPAVAGDVVVVPVANEGLAGVDVATGRARWRVPMTGGGFSSPLRLDDGGVAYAVGGVTVVEAVTGEVRWTRPGFDAVAPIAQDGEAVYVAAFSPQGTELLAFETGTGRIRWRRPLQVAALVGPAAGSGVVVAADTSGTVLGLDASSGQRLWAAASRSPLNGSPVILGERVVFAETGMLENLNAREYRVTVLDLRTGALQAQWEFGGGQAVAGGFGASVGRVIVPVLTTEFAAALVSLEGP